MIIKTPSRLHFGIIDLSRSLRREYGALGLTLEDGYEIEILAKNDKGLLIKGDERECRIVKKVHERLEKKFKLPHGFNVTIKKSVPRHVGLGATTQITLGTGFGMLKTIGEEKKGYELATMLERARYSAIGTYGFDSGGFIVEGGKTDKNEVPPLLFRSEVPEDWRFLIICPEKRKGYDEKEEKPIMDELKGERKYPEKICHNILMGLLPSLIKRDIQAFGEHLTNIQRLVGRSFADYQSGIYHPAVAEVMDKLVEETYGAGQSSWGPTAYGLVKASEVDEVKEKVLPNDHREYGVWVGKPDNQGVRVEE